MNYNFVSQIYRRLLKGERIFEVSLSEKTAFNTWLMSLTDIHNLPEKEKRRLTVFNKTRYVNRLVGYKTGQQAVEFSYGFFSKTLTKWEDYKEPIYETFEKQNYGGGLRSFMVLACVDRNAVEVRMILNDDVVIRRETGEIVK